MKCSDIIRLAAKETRLEKSKLFLGLLLWVSLLTVSLCIYRLSFSFRDNLYQYLAKYEPSIAKASYISEEPANDMDYFQQIGISNEEISIMAVGTSHLRFYKQDGTEILLPSPSNLSAKMISNTHEVANNIYDGRALTAEDDTKDGRAIVISMDLANDYDVSIGDSITVSLCGRELRTFTVCGITNDKDQGLFMSLPFQPFLSCLEQTGLFCPAYVIVTIKNPAAYYDLKAYMTSKGIAIESDFEHSLELIEIVSEAFWLVSLICMLLAMLSMMNYCSIFVSERKGFIVLLKTLGMKERSVTFVFYSVLIGLFVIAYIFAILLQQIVYLRFQTIYTSILHVTLNSIDHFSLFSMLCFMIDFVFVSVTFFARIGKLIYAENIAAVRLRDD